MFGARQLNASLDVCAPTARVLAPNAPPAFWWAGRPTSLAGESNESKQGADALVFEILGHFSRDPASGMDIFQPLALDVSVQVDVTRDIPDNVEHRIEGLREGHDYEAFHNISCERTLALAAWLVLRIYSITSTNSYLPSTSAQPPSLSNARMPSGGEPNWRMSRPGPIP